MLELKGQAASIDGDDAAGCIPRDRRHSAGFASEEPGVVLDNVMWEGLSWSSLKPKLGGDRRISSSDTMHGAPFVLISIEDLNDSHGASDGNLADKPRGWLSGELAEG